MLRSIQFNLINSLLAIPLVIHSLLSMFIASFQFCRCYHCNYSALIQAVRNSTGFGHCFQLSAFEFLIKQLNKLDSIN